VSIDPRDCDHPEFAAWVDVSRLTQVDGGPVTGYVADIRADCAVCGEAMVWLGAPVGFSPRQPTASVDGEILRVPLRPRSAPPGWGESGPGFRVRAFG
jgi:hypothetical protein